MPGTPVADLIRVAFPSEPFYGPITGGCTCEECTLLEQSLKRQSWQQVPDEVMDVQFGSLPLLSPEAFRAFLPAWLLRSLNDSNVREWTLYSLALYYDIEEDDLSQKTERLRSRAQLFTAPQTAAIRAFLELMLRQGDLSDWDRESITLSLEKVWTRAR